MTKYKDRWKKSCVKEVVSHASYLINLATKNSDLLNKSTDRLFIELENAAKLGIKLLVVHVGNYGKLEKLAGIRLVSNNLDRIIEKLSEMGSQTPRICIETMSGGGTSLGSEFLEISSIIENSNYKEFLNVCVDTAHLFAAGYEIRGKDNYNNVMKHFDDEIGLKKLSVIHLNDSKSDLGSRVDKHSCIGEGKIGLSFFRRVMQDRRFENIPKIIEIPDRDYSPQCLKLLRDLKKSRKVMSETIQTKLNSFLFIDEKK